MTLIVSFFSCASSSFFVFFPTVPEILLNSFGANAPGAFYGKNFFACYLLSETSYNLRLRGGTENTISTFFYLPAA
jgi:hypothetical protein